MLGVADLIRTDHREFERLFEELKDPDRRPMATPVLVAMLAAHARAEESSIYPALRNADEAKEKVEHSQEEHVEADELAEKLLDQDLDSGTYDKVLSDLVKGVSHHIEEEEDTVLPSLEKLDASLQDEARRQFIEIRAQHLFMGTEPTRQELSQQAQNEGKSGTSGMTKSELKQEVRN
jgi:hemerythrin superfamily protein